jgi:hypothetical protein
MKRKTLRFGKGFRVALANRRTQAAEMVIEPDPPQRSSAPEVSTACTNHIVAGCKTTFVHPLSR